MIRKWGHKAKEKCINTLAVNLICGSFGSLVAPLGSLRATKQHLCPLSTNVETPLKSPLAGGCWLDSQSNLLCIISCFRPIAVLDAAVQSIWEGLTVNTNKQTIWTPSCVTTRQPKFPSSAAQTEVVARGSHTPICFVPNGFLAYGISHPSALHREGSACGDGHVNLCTMQFRGVIVVVCVRFPTRPSVAKQLLDGQKASLQRLTSWRRMNETAEGPGHQLAIPEWPLCCSPRLFLPLFPSLLLYYPPVSITLFLVTPFLKSPEIRLKYTLVLSRESHDLRGTFEDLRERLVSWLLDESSSRVVGASWSAYSFLFILDFR